ncbi:MAG: hypothetical protein ACLUFV_06640 [Acutalibacteraceae bacterium]
MQKATTTSSPNACSAARLLVRRRGVGGAASAARFPPPRPSLNRRTHFRFPAQSAIRSLPLYADDGTAGLRVTPTLPKPEDAASPSEGLTDKQMLAWQEEQKAEQTQTPQTPVTSDKPAEPEQPSEPEASDEPSEASRRTRARQRGRVRLLPAGLERIQRRPLRQ